MMVLEVKFLLNVDPELTAHAPVLCVQSIPDVNQALLGLLQAAVECRQQDVAVARKLVEVDCLLNHGAVVLQMLVVFLLVSSHGR